MRPVHNLKAQVEQSILSRELFARGDAILVAVSGGMDSMVLLRVLSILAKEYDWQLAVAHFNHQLRGRSSDADERLVKRIADKAGFKFISDRADVKKLAVAQKQSIEMAARRLRHEFLARSAGSLNISKIALAHHADDQVELFFLRLMRGAGGDGLSGMNWQNLSPVNSQIRLTRPLLEQTKTALSAYAKSERVLFREDASNASLDIKRNRIRHELLPLLTAKYQPALTPVILREMEILSAETDYVNEVAKAWLKNSSGAPFEKLPLALQRTCVRLQLETLGLMANFDLVEQLRTSAETNVTVSQGIQVRRDGAGRVSVQKPNSLQHSEETVRVLLHGDAGEITFEKLRILWQVKPSPTGIFRAPPRLANCECLDLDKVGYGITLRHWQPGDRFQPIGLSKPVKLQDLFTNAKIGSMERRQLILGTASDGEVFWVEGLRLGEAFKLDKKTRYQLNWRWKRL